MALRLSPGLVNREKDLSFTLSAQGETIFALIGGALKGPINEVVSISNIQEYVSMFGNPSNPMGYAAQYYLREGKALKIVRVGGVAGGTAATGSIPGDTDPAAFSYLTYTNDPIPDSDPFIGVFPRSPISLTTDVYGGYRIVGSSQNRYFYVPYQTGVVAPSPPGATWTCSGTFNYNTRTLTLSDAGGNVDNSTVYMTCMLDGPEDSVKITAASEGSWANNLTLRISSGTSLGYKIQVLDSDLVVESWDNLANKAAMVAKFPQVGNASKYFYLEDIGPYAYPEINNNLPATRSLTGGAETGLDVNVSDILGVRGDVSTGMGLFADVDSQTIDLIAAPDAAALGKSGGGSTLYEDEAGYVAQALIELCENRGDCLALVDPPKGLSSTEISNWHNGTGYGHSVLSSSYASLCWPWNYFYDIYAEEYAYSPPSGAAAAVCCGSDRVSENWFAPAGMSRGKVVLSTNLQSNALLSVRETLYDGVTNSINCFIKNSDGVFLYGQRTLVRDNSALNRVNVRRLLLYLKRVLNVAARSVVFEQNDSRSRRRLVALLEAVVHPIKARQGIYDYRIICDSSVNTSDIIDQNQMVGKVLIKPTKTAEVVIVDWVLLSTGAEIQETLGDLI